jgi:hypothetical protein
VPNVDTDRYYELREHVHSILMKVDMQRVAVKDILLSLQRDFEYTAGDLIKIKDLIRAIAKVVDLIGYR